MYQEHPLTGVHKFYVPIKLAASMFASVGELTAQFAPLPWIAPAVTVLVGIIQVCQNVAVNRRAIHQLGGRCELLLLTLKDSNADAPPERMKPAVDRCVQVLTDIYGKMIAWSSLNRLKAFAMQDDIAEDIRRCHTLLNDCCASFQITSHMEIHKWQAEYEANRMADREEIIAFLTDIQNKQDLMTATMQAQRFEIQQFMGMMQDRMVTFDPGDRRHSDLQSNLYGVQQQSGMLLPNVDLRAGEVRRVGSHPCGGSPAFDIWEGQYLGTEKCAVKVIRGVEVGPDTMRRFLREVKIWRQIWEKDRGKYILPFYGVCASDGPYPYMVSPWMRNGDALSYVKKYPHVNRLYLIRRIAEGINLLHGEEPPIAHGDIKSANILINDVGSPLLADFGLSKIMEDITGVPFTQSRGVSDSYRWFAPELCCAPGVISTKSDVFSFSMTALELITSEQPFAHIKRTPEVLIKMQMGERPRRPTNPDVIARGLDENMWKLLTDCWHSEPDRRPTIKDVLTRLPVVENPLGMS